MKIVELYSVRDVSKIFGLAESRLRYWLQSGFLWPSVRRGGRFYYTFQDLIGIKAAKQLLELGIPVQRVRRALDALRAGLPGDVSPASRLRVCCDGETLVVVGDDAVYQPESGQLVMAFAVTSLTRRIADTLDAPPTPLTAADAGRAAAADAADVADVAAAPAAPEPIDDRLTERTATSSYHSFTEGLAAEERGDDAAAERCYRTAIDGEPTLAAAHTNLGNVCHRRGQPGEARRAYQRALELDPLQPEARFNLANLHGDGGELDLAIAELRQVVARSPDFADAHYNLGLLLAQVGGVAQAEQHLARYLALDGAGEWAARAREVLARAAG